MPSTYALHLHEIALQEGLDLLEEADLSLDQLQNETYIPLQRYLQVINAFDRLSPNDDWAFDYGQRLGISAHGALGLVAVSASTVGEGLADLCRFIRTRTCSLRAHTQDSEEGLLAEFEHGAEIRQQLAHACELTATMVQCFLTAATGRQNLPLRWKFPYPAPNYAALYDRYLWGKLEYNGATMQLVLPPTLASMPSLLKDEALCGAARRKCAELLQELYADPGIEDVRALLGKAYARRVRESQPVSPIPTAPALAAALQISPRTLMRRLKAADTSLKALKDQFILAYLREMLRAGNKSASHMGLCLGYDSPGNFTRACKRLLGETPQSLIRQARAGDIR